MRSDDKTCGWTPITESTTVFSLPLTTSGTSLLSQSDWKNHKLQISAFTRSWQESQISLVQSPPVLNPRQVAWSWLQSCWHRRGKSGRPWWSGQWLPPSHWPSAAPPHAPRKVWCSHLKHEEQWSKQLNEQNVWCSSISSNSLKTCTHGANQQTTCNCNKLQTYPCYHQETHWAAAIHILNDNGTPWPLHVDQVANLNNLHLGAHHRLCLIQRHRTQPRQKMEHCFRVALVPSLRQYGHAWPAMAANPKRCSPHSWQKYYNMVAFFLSS